MGRPTNNHVQVSVSSMTTMDARDDGVVNLRVEDSVSGEVLADLEMPAGRWWRLMQGGVMTVPAFTTTHPERIGKAMQNTSVTIDRAMAETLTGNRDPRTQEDEIRRYAEKNPPAGWADFERAEPRRTNFGWEVVYRRWTADMTVVEKKHSDAAERVTN